MSSNQAKAIEILERLRKLGVLVSAEENRLAVRAPKGVLKQEDKDLLTSHRDSLVSYLQEPENCILQEFPLTDIQQAYWVGRNSMTLGNVGCHAYREMSTSDIDLDRLTHAWQRLIDRHEMLRAVVSEDGFQRVLRDGTEYKIIELDLRDSANTKNRLSEVRSEMSHRNFDPTSWPLFDIRVTRLEQEVRIHISMDLLIADAASMLQLYREWGQLYRTPDHALPELRKRFSDYVLETRNNTEAELAAEAYWRPRLDNLPGPPELPLAKAPEDVTLPKFTRHSHTINSVTWKHLRAAAQTNGLTPSNLLVAAYADILATWSKTQHFTITLTTFRSPPDYDDVVGDFTSTVLLEVDTQAQRFVERARAIQSRLLDDLDHDGWSGVRVIRELSRHRQTSAASVPIVFTSAMGHQASVQERLPISWLGKTEEAITQTPQVWIDHHAIEDGETLVVSWDLVEELFPDRIVRSMFSAYCDFLASLATDASAWHRSVGDHVPADQLETRKQANSTQVSYPPGLLHDSFFDHAARSPDRPAVQTPKATISYGQLADISRSIAKIISQQGLRRGDLVGIAMDKDWEQAAAAIGVVSSGAAYLPINPELPKARRHYLAEHGRLTVVLTQSHLLHLEWPPGIKVVAVDQLPRCSEMPSAHEEVKPDDLAYVIYTSGSTGEPKGVMIEHQSARNTIDDVNRRFGVTQADAVFGLSSLSFDLSVYDIFGLLSCGGRLVLPSPERLRDPKHWLTLIEEYDVTVWNTVPALLGMLLEDRVPLGDQLRVVMLSGDWIPIGLPERLSKLATKSKLYALGGATEASIWSNWFHVTKLDPAWRSIPYGWPLTNQRYHILNEQLGPCPDGVPGELFIAGDGLARGYLADPEKTNEKFFVHPNTGERLYRTGDLGRYYPDGSIEFLGREDFQVKIGGHRVELGEIEVALKKHPSVDDAVVITLGSAGEQLKLAAYLVMSSETPTPSRVENRVQNASGSGLHKNAPERLAFLFERTSIRPNNGNLTRIPLTDTLSNEHPEKQRRTFRHFLSRPVTLQEISEMLSCIHHHSFARDNCANHLYDSLVDQDGIDVWLYAKPDRVEGLSGGLYRYHADGHQLELLSQDLRLDRECYLTDANQLIFDSAAFAIFLVMGSQPGDENTAQIISDRYLLQAGYIGQLLMEQVVDTDIGLCPIGGVDTDGLTIRQPFVANSNLVHSFLGGIGNPGKTSDLLGDGASSVDTPAVGNTNDLEKEVKQTSLTAELKEWLSAILPAYMVPETYVKIAQLPLNSNGKIDRTRLPTINEPPVHEPGVKPQGELETMIAKIVSDTLAIGDFGRDDLFFDLGGTSVHMVRIRRQLEEWLQQEVDIIDLFRYPSVSRLASRLNSLRDAPPTVNAATRRGNTRRIPLRRRKSADTD